MLLLRRNFVFYSGIERLSPLWDDSTPAINCSPGGGRRQPQQRRWPSRLDVGIALKTQEITKFAFAGSAVRDAAEGQRYGTFVP